MFRRIIVVLLLVMILGFAWYFTQQRVAPGRIIGPMTIIHGPKGEVIGGFYTYHTGQPLSKSPQSPHTTQAVQARMAAHHFSFPQDIWSAPVLPSSYDTIKSDSDGGYRLVVNGEQWAQMPGSISPTMLGLRFHLERPDGSTAQFASTQNSVLCSGSFSDSIDDQYSDERPASQVENSTDWCAAIQNVDPRWKSAHVVFQVRDPNVTQSQSGSLMSNFTVDSIPKPLKPNVTEKLNCKYKTALGTVITFSGLTYIRSGTYGYPSININFNASNPLLPDEKIDQFTIELTDSFHRLMVEGSFNNTTSTGQRSGVISCLFGQQQEFLPGGTITANVMLQESSLKRMEATRYYKFGLDIPLSKIPLPQQDMQSVSDNAVTVNGTKFRFEQTCRGPMDYALSLIWITPKSQDVKWRVTNVDWSKPSSVTEEPISFNADQPQYWHHDSTPISADETGANFETPDGMAAPYEITAHQYSTALLTATFSNLPVPALGQPVTVNRKPDDQPNSPLTLTSIFQGLPYADPEAKNYRQIGLSFSYSFSPTTTYVFKVTSVTNSVNKAVPFSSFAFKSALNPYVKQLSQNIGLQNPVGPLNITTSLSSETEAGPPLYLIVDQFGKISQTFTPPAPGVRP